MKFSYCMVLFFMTGVECLYWTDSIDRIVFPPRSAGYLFFLKSTPHSREYGYGVHDKGLIIS